ncbi:MAG: glutaminyl-peptide cyclotransferase [Acidobacteriota bacterium]|nr:glutaminyl-peptide cyclotransferase [Acidobacteriota bacterium]
MRLLNFLLLPFAVCLFGAACNDQTNQNNSISVATNTNTNAAATTPKNAIPTYSYEVVNIYKHDSQAFTQGLIFYNGFLYESTGQHGRSTLRKVRLEDGDVVKKRKLNDRYFAEGLTIFNDKLYQLTWQENTCFIYDVNSFEPTGELKYIGEGWGLTNDGTNLIMSDGSHQLKFVNPTNFQNVRTITVTHEGKPQFRLNELEYIKGEIWANIWHSEDPEVLGKPNIIARIDPNSGKIVGWIDLNGISPEDVARNEENTLNGIAYDAQGDRIFVTGKNWRKLFEIKIKSKNS